MLFDAPETITFCEKYNDDDVPSMSECLHDTVYTMPYRLKYYTRLLNKIHHNIINCINTVQELVVRHKKVE